MNNPKTLFLIAFTLFTLAFTFIGVQATRAHEPAQPLQSTFSSSAAIFQRDKAYYMLYQEGLSRTWVYCKVVDAKDNWVKCNGAFIKDDKSQEKFAGWINANNLSRVNENF